jgi:antitoxin VapB
MQVTKVFKSGNSQAVRIPVEFQFDTDEVEIFRRDVIHHLWGAMFWRG